MNRQTLLACLVSVAAVFAVSLVVSPLARASPAGKWRFHGGVLVLAVTFTTTDGSGIVVGGSVTVTCVIGDSVPPGSEEGVTSVIPGAISFDESVSGNTLFVLTP